MPTPARALAVGTALALVILVAGFIHSSYRDSRLETLVAECEKDEITIAAEEAKNDPPNAWYKANPVICDPDYRASGDIVMRNPSVSARMSAELREQRYWTKNSYTAAAVVFLLGLLPAAWYFALNRIRELRNALLGK